MRSVLCFLIVAGAVPVCAGGSETSVAQLATAQPSSTKLALVTFGPGQRYWERFGHNAIIVDDSAAGTRVVYNYGAFDFQEKHFLLNFALGQMRYSLVAQPLDAAVAIYAAAGRSVTVQILNLTPMQARRLAQFLAWNAQPQNAQYRYDYFANNCSTRVRDALNQALDGTLERQLVRQPAGHTYRFDAVRLISADFWLALGMDALIGPQGDVPLSLWQESFLSMVLSRSLDAVTVRGTNGETAPLVSDEQVVLPGKLPPAPAAPPALRLPLLTAGMGWAALLLWLGHGKGGLYRWSFALAAVAWWLICGFFGLLLAVLWGWSDHWAIWSNENLLLLDPLCLALPVVWWRAPRIAWGLASLIAAAALLSLVVRTLPGLYQSNLAFIALALPVHLALAALAWRRRPVASPLAAHAG